MTPFRHSISRAAVVAAHHHIYRQTLPDDGSDPRSADEVAKILDDALELDGGFNAKQEVLDTFNPTRETYLARVKLEKFTLVGILAPLHANHAGPWQGVSGYILVTVFSKELAAREFRDGRWKSMDGKLVLVDRPSLGERERALRSSSTPSADSRLVIDPVSATLGMSQEPDQPVSAACSVCNFFFSPIEEHFYFVRGRRRKQCKGCYKAERKEYRSAGTKKKKRGKVVVSNESQTVVEKCESPSRDSTDELGESYTDVRSELRELFSLETAQQIAVEQATALLSGTRDQIRLCLDRVARGQL